jgi:hypothetical protein
LDSDAVYLVCGAVFSPASHGHAMVTLMNIVVGIMVLGMIAWPVLLPMLLIWFAARCFNPRPQVYDNRIFITPEYDDRRMIDVTPNRSRRWGTAPLQGD